MQIEQVVPAADDLATLLPTFLELVFEAQMVPQLMGSFEYFVQVLAHRHHWLVRVLPYAQELFCAAWLAADMYCMRCLSHAFPQSQAARHTAATPIPVLPSAPQGQPGHAPILALGATFAENFFGLKRMRVIDPDKKVLKPVGRRRQVIGALVSVGGMYVMSRAQQACADLLEDPPERESWWHRPLKVLALPSQPCASAPLHASAQL
eukprot:gene1507-2811_t